MGCCWGNLDNLQATETNRRQSTCYMCEPRGPVHACSWAFVPKGVVTIGTAPWVSPQFAPLALRQSLSLARNSCQQNRLVAAGGSQGSRLSRPALGLQACTTTPQILTWVPGIKSGSQDKHFIETSVLNEASLKEKLLLCKWFQ